MKNYPLILAFIMTIFVSNCLLAASITQRGTIDYISLEKHKIIINIEVNNVQLIKQTYLLDLKNVKVWWNNRRIYIGRLEKGMKIEFRSQQGKIYSIRVLDNNGYNLEPEG